MAYKRTNGNVRRLDKGGTLSMEVGGEYAQRCFGLACAVVIGQGYPVYGRVNRDGRQALLRIYFPDDTAEGWIDMGPDVREEVAAIIEAAFTAELANKLYDACGDRPAEPASKAPPARPLGRKSSQAPSVAPEVS